MQLDEILVTTTDITFWLVCLFGPDEIFLHVKLVFRKQFKYEGQCESSTHGMRVVPEPLFDRCSPHSGYVNVPTIDIMTTGRIDRKSIPAGASFHDFHFGEAYPLFITRSGRYAGDYHELQKLLCL